MKRRVRNEKLKERIQGFQEAKYKKEMEERKLFEVEMEKQREREVIR